MVWEERIFYENVFERDREWRIKKKGVTTKHEMMTEFGWG